MNSRFFEPCFGGSVGFSCFFGCGFDPVGEKFTQPSRQHLTELLGMMNI